MSLSRHFGELAVDADACHQMSSPELPQLTAASPGKLTMCQSSWGGTSRCVRMTELAKQCKHSCQSFTAVKDSPDVMQSGRRWASHLSSGWFQTENEIAMLVAIV